MQWIRAQLLLCFVLGLVVLMAPRPAGAQLAPTGGHYAARGTDTGFSGDVVANGDYGGTVSLDLPPVRGNAALPVHLNYVGNHFGAAGLGWDLPLSFIRLDKTFDHRRPVVNGNSGIFGREELVLMLDGQKVPLVPKGSAWMGQLNPQIEGKRPSSR